MDDLESADYIILSFVNSGVNTFNGIFTKIPKASIKNLDKRSKSLIKRGYIKKSSKDGFLTRHLNPTISLTELGQENIDNMTSEIKDKLEKFGSDDFEVEF